MMWLFKWDEISEQVKFMLDYIGEYKLITIGIEYKYRSRSSVSGSSSRIHDNEIMLPSMEILEKWLGEQSFSTDGSKNSEVIKISNVEIRVMY